MSAGASHRSIAGLVVVFALVAAPWALLLREYPAYIHDHVTANRLYDAQRFSVLQGIREMSSWVGLTARSEVFWDYLNPAFLFFSRNGLFESLTSPKVFLTPLVVLIPVGLYHVATRSSSLAKWVLIGGLLTAPIPGALTAQPPIASRFTNAIPFAALLATHGLAGWLSGRLPQRTRRTMVELG
jgi:hypothetical protein